MTHVFYDWIASVRTDVVRVEPLTGDASFRRYHRVFCPHNTFVAVDGSQEKPANLQFAKIAQSFLACGLHVPTILATDFERGYLLLSDLGDTLYLKALTTRMGELSDLLYPEALNALHKLQICSLSLPLYDEVLLQREMNLFTDWFLTQHLGLQLGGAAKKILAKLYQFLIEQALAQPRVCVHRDYHSRNLMVVGENNPGILDFQDAVYGPITYDCVSLLKDCYIQWPAEKIAEWLLAFFEAGKWQDSPGLMQFTEWFDWMGAQRHLKAIGIFARLWHRDKKDAYLQDIPRTLSYLTDLSLKYPSLSDFRLFLEEEVLCKMQ